MTNGLALLRVLCVSVVNFLLTYLSSDDAFELLFDVRLDLAFEHHGGEGQVAVELEVVLVDGDSALQLNAERLEAEVQRVAFPRLVQIADLARELCLQHLDEPFQPRSGFFPGQLVRYGNSEFGHGNSG